jgi:hypothetical protein
MGTVWVILKGSYNPHDKRVIEPYIFASQDRFYLDTDGSGMTITFATSEQALEYAVRKYGLHRARVAKVPLLMGDSQSGFWLEGE